MVVNLLDTILYVYYFLIKSKNCFSQPIWYQWLAKQTSNQTFIVPKVSNQLDNPTLQITTKKLNDHKFLEWSQSAKLFLLSRGKMEYLRGTTIEPKTSDPNFES